MLDIMCYWGSKCSILITPNICDPFYLSSQYLQFLTNRGLVNGFKQRIPKGKTVCFKRVVFVYADQNCEGTNSKLNLNLKLLRDVIRS